LIVKDNHLEASQQKLALEQRESKKHMSLRTIVGFNLVEFNLLIQSFFHIAKIKNDFSKMLSIVWQQRCFQSCEIFIYKK